MDNPIRHRKITTYGETIGVRAAGVVFVALATSCAKPAIGLFDQSLRLPPTCAPAVTFVADQSKAPADYREIALLTGYGRDSAAFVKLRESAASVGATGIILGATRGSVYRGTTTGSDQDAVAIFSAADTARGRALCASLMPVQLRGFIGRTVDLRNARDVPEPWLTRSVLAAVGDSSATLRVGNAERALSLASIERFYEESLLAGAVRLVIVLKNPGG